MKVPIAKTYFDERDFELIQEPLKSGWVVQGSYVKRLEETFARFTGASYAVAVTSGTSALHLAMVALGIGPGDEVIVPAFTWIATANAVEYVGAKPVFCDIDLVTYNIDLAQVEDRITPRTKAIVPVHLFGLACDMDWLGKIAEKHGLMIMEDAACGLGARFRGKHVGTFGDPGCFSFHPRKAITTGEGGMLITSDQKRYELLQALRNHGASLSDFARHNAERAFLLSEYKYLGYNYRMTDFQGALGVAQMEKVDWLFDKRRERAAKYDELLRDVSFLRCPSCPSEMIHGYQSYVCLFAPEPVSPDSLADLNRRRDDLMVAMEKQGVSTRQGTHAVTLQGFYQKKYGIRNEDFPNAWMADKLTMALPLYPQITDEEQQYVVNTIISEYKG
ncbi:MAG: DegT/DnrJ/EryC1/StrS family aminotransferase [candidate division Zixibacteria bacterium]|nr:DegT/DnrJ/EryC1/StrS family aminotransferase [candidate division Zixibacteria bacterium]